MRDDGAPPTDADLVAASLREPQRFAPLFDRHARTVHRYVSSRVGRDEVDDVVSETFVVAFRTRARYDPDYENARPWLLGIATNVVRQHRRSEIRRLARLRAVVHAPTPIWTRRKASARRSTTRLRAIASFAPWPDSTTVTGTSCCWPPAPTSPTKKSPEHSESRSVRCGRASPAVVAGYGNC